MLRTTRRVLTGPLLVAAIGAGMLAAPSPARAAGSTATIRVSGTLKTRSAPSTSSAIVGSLGNNATVQIDCVISGQQVRGAVRSTNVWDKLTDGSYVSHAYVVATGTLRRCVALSPEAVPVRTKPSSGTDTVVGRVRSADGNVNLRSGPSSTSTVVGSARNGSAITLACGVAGTRVDGTVRNTTQWNRTDAGQYISHAYVIVTGLKLCPTSGTGTPPPASTPTLTTEQFIAAAVPGAQRGWREFGVPPSVTIAQAILESGWGRSGLASVDKNYFGIKCFGGRYGTIANGCHTYNTQECTKAGTCFDTTASFRTYASMADSFRDHGNFLKVNSRYQPAFAYTTNANTFIWKVWKAGYATDPNYYTKITGIMAANGLYQYDTWK